MGVVSLLQSGPHEVLVFPEVEVLDDAGDPIRVPSPVPIAVATYVQALSATEAADLDVDPRTTRYFNTAQALPAGAWARVEWDGRAWDVLGEPQRIGRTHRTAHTHVVISARDPRQVISDGDE